MKQFKLLFIAALAIILSDCSSTKPEQQNPRDPNARPERRGPRAGGASRNNPEGDNTPGDTYSINLDASDCDVDIEDKLGISSIYQEVIDTRNNLRKISINSVANHNVGAFPNSGNPNTIKESKLNFNIPLTPKFTGEITSAQGFDSGVLFSGVSIDPFTAEMFIGSDGQMNPQYNITTLTTTENLGLDCNNAHVQPTGKYHYHGTPSAFLNDLDVDGTQMVKIGYASDGFPLYYKFGYNANGQVIAHESGYKLKKGERGGDGITAPDGTFNGRYFSDYEYDSELSDLDACNGRWGKTPESDNEYYYVVTDNFPSVPLCFAGTPSAELRKGGGNGGPPRQGRGRPQRGGGSGGNSETDQL